MIEEIISEFFARQGWTWHLKKGRVVTPTENDVLAAFDEAARLLTNEPVGTRLSVGRLIIEKKTLGHDVYMYVGEFL